MYHRLIVLLLAVSSLAILTGCATEYVNRNPMGQMFPSISGKSLDQRHYRIPQDLPNRQTLLLIGYKQASQFDIDRWVMGLLQTETPMRLVEVPTIPGLVPTIASGWIDDGMRSGIPREDWGAVVTLYGEAARPVAELTGTERGRLTRVVVLDGEGTIVWFDDEGYSPRKAMQVAGVVAGLQ